MANPIQFGITEIEFKGGQKKAVVAEAVIADGVLFVESGDVSEAYPFADIKSLKTDEAIEDILTALTADLSGE